MSEIIFDIGDIVVDDAGDKFMITEVMHSSDYNARSVSISGKYVQPFQTYMNYRQSIRKIGHVDLKSIIQQIEEM